MQSNIICNRYDEIILFQDYYPHLLKSIKILNIYDVYPMNYKFIKDIKIRNGEDINLLKYLEITKLDINGVKLSPLLTNNLVKGLPNLTHLSCNDTPA